jgi:putative heme-binding domain-containing protein
MVQGGRFQRQAGSHFNPYVYDDIKTVADHVHWAGNKGPHAANGRSAAAGGGHAHAGLLVYQGDNWPEEYRNKIYIGNIHGACINTDIPEAKGSGFVGHHGQNLISFNDTWSQILNMQTGPDGSEYFIDWYDKNQCHHLDPNGHDQRNGRIFKVSYGSPQMKPVDLQKKTNQELIELLASENSWQARHAQRILQERFSHELARPIDGMPIGAELYKFGAKNKSPIAQLRALWAMHVTSGFKALKDRNEFLSKTNEFVRAWAIQLRVEELMDESKSGSQSEWNSFAEALVRRAADKSPVVRLYVASALQRMPVEHRWDVLAELYKHSEDTDDHNLPLMVWYAAEPLPTQDFERALAMAESAKLPTILNFTVRRTAALDKPEAFAAITKALLAAKTDQQRLAIVNGLSVALQGRRNAPMPQGWNEVETKLGNSKNGEVRAQVQSLSLTFGSASALAALRKTLTDGSAEPSARRTALESLLAAKAAGMAPDLQMLLSDSNLRGPALRGLAVYDDPQTPAKILAVYKTLNPAEKNDALNTLCGRVAFAKPLLAAVDRDEIPRKDLSADLVRQLRTLKNDELNKLVAKVWGEIHETSADKKAVIEKYKKVYWAGGSQPGDASRGRLVFSKTCQQCHTLFDTGGKVGPDLTGSARADLSYILENIVDPNAVIPNDYRASTIEMKDDRVITGIVKKQDDTAVTVVTPNETLVLPRKEISAVQQSQLSMMPEGLMDQLNEQEVRDLLYYLSRPGQVPMAQAGK